MDGPDVREEFGRKDAPYDEQEGRVYRKEAFQEDSVDGEAHYEDSVGGEAACRTDSFDGEEARQEDSVDGEAS